MTLLEIVVLALLQGLTEFLPISSSAHLILPSALMGFSDQGLAFDVAVHVGTLSAVLIYFRKDIVNLSNAWIGHCIKGESSHESTLAWMIILATVPAGLAGLAFGDFIENHLRSISVIAFTTIFFGVCLGLADKFSTRSVALEKITWRSALFIGAAQALALIPGTSRSGITITAALALGFDRVSASRFSFLLSIPVIFLSGAYKTWQLAHAENVPWRELLLGSTLSAITAYCCIFFFLRWINQIGMMPFVYYRLILGFGLLAILFW